MGAQKTAGDTLENKISQSAEFVIDAEKREEQLIARVYRLSHLLSDSKLSTEQEEQIKLILEDALAELDILNEKLQPQISKSKHLFH